MSNHKPRVSSSHRRANPWIPCVAVAFAALGCNGSRGTGRDWVNAGNSIKLPLRPKDAPHIQTDGVLNIGNRFHPIIRRNYANYCGVVAHVLKGKHLFNRIPTPLRIYFMLDAEQYLKYGPVDRDPVGTFVVDDGSIYVHANGKQLVDAGRSRVLVREITRATLFDMFGGDCPAWIQVGLPRIMADGAFGRTDKENPEPFEIFDWFEGAPDPTQWRPLLAADRPEFADVRKATAEGLDKMGDSGKAVATAAVYLLHQLEQLKNVVWQMQPLKRREPQDVLTVLEANDPRYAAHFDDPAAALFQLRPDLRVYVECEPAQGGGGSPPDAGDVARSGDNARQNPAVGAYWWQYARLLLARGETREAIGALEKCRACNVHRGTRAALVRLADLYYGEKNLTALAPVVQQQIAVALLPTPRMHLMAAECSREEDPDIARRQVEFGLQLPVDGFADTVTALKALRVELSRK